MPDKTIVDPTIGGIQSNYPTISIHKGNPDAVQISNTSVSKEKLLALPVPSGYYWHTRSYVGAELPVVASVTGVTPDKVLAGKNACGVDGTATNDANLSAQYMLEGQSAYVKGVKVNGTMPNIREKSTINHTSSNVSKVLIGDEAYVSTNTDGVNRAQIRYNSTPGYITENTLIGIEQSKMASAIGLTADKMILDQSCLGINGVTGAAYKHDIRLIDIPNKVIYTTQNFNDFIKHDNATLIFEGPVLPEYKYIILRTQYNGDPAVTLGKINTSVNIIRKVLDDLQMVTFKRNNDGIVTIRAINYGDYAMGSTIDIVGHTNINISGFTNW